MKVLRKAVVLLLLAAAALAILAVGKRYDLALWYLRSHPEAREAVILQILETARPVIESEFTMTALQKIFSAIAGRRNEKERQADAFRDVRTFCEAGFMNRRIEFADVHRLGSLNGFIFQGFDLALVWNNGRRNEILFVFAIDFLKREIGPMRINENCGFFNELRLYVEKRAGQN